MAPKRIGDSFPPQQAVPQSKAQEFVQLLAGFEPLHKLATMVPHAAKGESLLRSLVDKEVPLLRATWYIKVIYLNMINNDQRKQQMAKPSEDWTRTLTNFLFQKLLPQTKEPRKWNYAVRLLNWNYFEGTSALGLALARCSSFLQGCWTTRRYGIHSSAYSNFRATTTCGSPC